MKRSASVRRVMALGVSALLAAAACDSRRPSQASVDRQGSPPMDALDSALNLPRTVHAPAVIVFWLAASDTLLPDDAAAAYEELSLATEHIVQRLKTFEIELLPTHADTLYVELPNHERRMVLLSGLEFPFGYVLIEPGSAERVLTGVVGEAELLDEIRVYFDLPEDSAGSPPPVST